MKKLLFLLVIFPSVLVGQTATFWADTSQLNGRSDIHDKIMEAEWRINGQTLRYGSKPVAVKTDSIIDTILFKQYTNSKWDTLICTITKPGKYIFHYNACCGGFNISDETNRFIMGSVVFIVKDGDRQSQYLGTLGEAGILATRTLMDTLRPGCRSAMSPNVYRLTFSEIESCTDTIDCTEVTCLYEKGKEELNYEFGYRIISAKLDCLYLPLSNQPLKVIYDPRTGLVKIE